MNNLYPIQQVLDNWINMGRLIVGSLGALAFVGAFLWRIFAISPRSVMEANRWLQRIVIGTIGVELSTVLAHLVVGSVQAH
jgi:hypothetical protein